MALKNIYFDTWKEYVEFVTNCQANIDKATHAKFQQEQEQEKAIDKEIDNQIEELLHKKAQLVKA